MKLSGSAVAVAAVVLFASSTFAQSVCDPTQIAVDSVTNQPQVKFSKCGSQTSVHFLSARGAYTNALTVNALLPSAARVDLTPTSACHLFGQITPGDPLVFKVATCLLYTKECESQALISNQCKPDAQTQPGEVNCSCLVGRSGSVVSWPAGSQVSLFPQLWVDENRDVLVDRQFDPDKAWSWPGGKPYTLLARPVRYAQFWPNTVNLEWEDQFPGFAADFNDYVAMVNFNDCLPGRFPPQVSSPQIVSCVDRCGNNPCGEDDLNGTARRFSVAISVDKANSEIPREPNGRLFRTTVILHEDFSTLPSTGKQLAFCPVVHLDWGTARAPTEKTDWTTYLQTGSPSCSTTAVDDTGAQQCARTELASDSLPLAFSAHSEAGPACGAKPEVFESHVPVESRGCGPVTSARDYEISLSQIDASLTDSSFHLSGLSSADILERVAYVDIFVILDPTTDFQCPSGVNVDYDGATPDSGRVVRYRLTRKDSAVVLFERP